MGDNLNLSNALAGMVSIEKEIEFEIVGGKAIAPTWLQCLECETWCRRRPGNAYACPNKECQAFMVLEVPKHLCDA